jgi:hypothetical protein
MLLFMTKWFHKCDPTSLHLEIVSEKENDEGKYIMH